MVRNAILGDSSSTRVSTFSTTQTEIREAHSARGSTSELGPEAANGTGVIPRIDISSDGKDELLPPKPLSTPPDGSDRPGTVRKKESFEQVYEELPAGFTRPLFNLTAPEIVAELDLHVIGQTSAKRALAVALRNRMRRQKLEPGLREEVHPKNVLLIGTTGCGKSELARRLAKIMRAPVVKVEASSFTQVGYVGRNVESMVRDLVRASQRLVKQEQEELVHDKARERAEDRLWLLLTQPSSTAAKVAKAVNDLDSFENLFSGGGAPSSPAAPILSAENRSTLRAQLADGTLDRREVEIEVANLANPLAGLMNPALDSGQDVDMDDDNPFLRMIKGKSTQRMTARKALDTMTVQEQQKLVDRGYIQTEALSRAEELGIIVIDEFDKIATRSNGMGPDVNGEGVQRELLPIIEGSVVQTGLGPMKTDNILFIGAGAFNVTRPQDLIPEMQGRFPIQVPMEPLSEAVLLRILTEPEYSQIKQYSALLASDGVHVRFREDGLQEIARVAHRLNTDGEDTGARRLHAVLEHVLQDAAYDGAGAEGGSLTVSREFVIEKMATYRTPERATRKHPGFVPPSFKRSAS